MSSPCPPVVLFLRSSVVGKKKPARMSGRAGSSCHKGFRSSPPHVLLLPFCCPSSGLGWPRLPAYLRSRSSHHRLVFLVSSVSSLPLLLLISSWRAPLMLSCCPFGVVPPQLVLLLSSWCVLVAFLPSSFCPLLSSSCPPLVFLLSCCLRCFPRQGLGLRPPQQQFSPTKLFGVYPGIIFYSFRFCLHFL